MSHDRVHSLRSSDHSDFMRITGTLAETFSRVSAISNQSILNSGREHLVAITLSAGQVVATISFWAATTLAGTPLNQWFSLRDASRVLLGITADDTTTAWAANNRKTLTLAAPYTVPTTARYYLGIMVNASTPPTLAALANISTIVGQAPIISGQDATNTGLTTPATAPGTSAALTQQSAIPFAYVS